MSFGKYTYGSPLIYWINENAKLVVGNFCSISSGVSFYLGGNHRHDWVTTYPFGHIHLNTFNSYNGAGHPSTKGDIIIGNDVWIGAGATIMSCIRIGDGAVVSANACVVKDVASYHIVGGNPAKSIKQRFEDDIVAILLRLKWWDLSLENIKNITKILSSKPDKSILLELISTYRK